MSLGQTCLTLSHATWGPNSPRGGGTTDDMILSQATNGNTEYEIYDIGNNAISAGYLLGKIGADWQFAGLGGFTAGANCRPAALMLASAGCGYAVALGYVRELPIAIISRLIRSARWRVSEASVNKIRGVDASPARVMALEE